MHALCGSICSSPQSLLFASTSLICYLALLKVNAYAGADSPLAQTQVPHIEGPPLPRNASVTKSPNSKSKSAERCSCSRKADVIRHISKASEIRHN